MYPYTSPTAQPPKCEPQRKTEPAKSEESIHPGTGQPATCLPVYMDSTYSHKLTIDPKVPIYNDMHDRIYPDNISSLSPQVTRDVYKKKR